MNELSQEARSLLAPARNATLPAGPRRQNIKRRVLLRAATVAAASAGAGVAAASSLAGKLVLAGIVATMATGGAIGVWKWHASGEGGLGRRNHSAPSAKHERPQPAGPASTEPALSSTQAPAFLLGEPSAPVTKLATRDRPLAPTPSPSTGTRGTLAQGAPRGEDTIPRLQPALEPPNPPQPTGQGRAMEAWVVQPPAAQAVASASTSVPGMGQAYPTAPASSSPHALPSPAQEPSSQVAGPGRVHPTFQARQPMLAPPGPPGGTLEHEVAELRRAQEALRSGQPALALRLLAEYDHAYPAGSLREERAAIAAIATCQLDPGPQARARAQAFLREAPRSLLAKRVRAACLQQAEAAK